MRHNDTTPSKTKVVVLGLGINGLALVRSVAVHGVDVWGVYVQDNEFARFSRYCRPFRFPQLKNGEEEFLRALIENLGNPQEKPVLFAESDEYVMFMSRNRNQLQLYFRFLLPNHKLLETLVRKDRSAAFVAEKGMRIPETYFPSKEESIDRILANVQYPCLAKPVDSFSVNLGAKTLTFPDESSLKAFLLERPELIGSIIIQQIIPGGDSNTYQATTYASKDLTISSIFTMRKIRQYPPDFGVTSYGISETVPSLAEKVQELLASIQYRGLISIEFKRHPRTGEWFYIESNPRLPYYHALIYDSGINFPYIYYQDMLGLKPIATLPSSPKNGLRWICFHGDLGSFARKFSRRQIGIGYWLVSIMRARSFAYFNRKDMKPFLHATHDLMKTLLQKVGNKLGLLTRN